MSTSPYAIALDVGGTSVKSGVVTPGGHIIGTPEQTPIDSTGDAETILTTFAGILQRHIQQYDLTNLAGVGFGFPGPFDYETGICQIAGLEKYEALYGVNIGDALRKRVKLGDRPIRFRNDAEAAIVGEVRYGAGKSYQRVIGVTLGTGFGSAFLIDGVPQVAGEGVPPHGWLYPELYEGVRADDCFSIRGLGSRLAVIGIEFADVKSVAEMARQGHAGISKVFEQFGLDMGQFLQPLAAKFRADAILTLGGIAGAFDLFGHALQAVLNFPVLPGTRGTDAALLGAADLVLEE